MSTLFLQRKKVPGTKNEKYLLETANKAPAQAGTYDFRMHNTDDNGKEVASVSFQVSH